MSRLSNWMEDKINNPDVSAGGASTWFFEDPEAAAALHLAQAYGQPNTTPQNEDKNYIGGANYPNYLDNKGILFRALTYMSKRDVNQLPSDVTNPFTASYTSQQGVAYNNMPYLARGAGSSGSGVVEAHTGTLDQLGSRPKMAHRIADLRTAIEEFSGEVAAGMDTASALIGYDTDDVDAFYTGKSQPTIASTVSTAVTSMVEWLLDDSATSGKPLYDARAAMNYVISNAANYGRGFVASTGNFIENDATAAESDTAIDTLVGTGNTAATGEGSSASALTDMGSWMDDVTGDVDAEVVDAAEVLVPMLLTGANTKIGTVFSAAMSAAYGLVVNAGFTDLLDGMQRSFTSSIANEHMRGLNRLAGLFVEGNAVNSSAFLIANSMMESDHLQRIADYRAKLELDTYNKAFDQYVTTFNQQSQMYIGLYQNMMQQEGQVYLQSLGYKLDLAKTVTQLAVEYHTQRLRERFNTYHEHLKSLVAVEDQVFREGTQSFRQLFDSYLRTYTTSDLQTRQQAHDLLMRKSSEAIAEEGQKVQYETVLLDAFRQWHATYVTMMEESIDRRTEYFYKRQMYPFELWNNVGNLISIAQGGMAGRATTGETKGSSLVGGISGLLSGAGAGAGIGSMMAGSSGAAAGGIAALGGPAGLAIMGGMGLLGAIGGSQ